VNGEGPGRATAEAIEHHYDVGNDFYGLWLDRSLSYTCGMWDEEDTLESAQARKVDYLIDAAGAHGAQSVLDVGCGWGGTMRRLLDGHGAEHTVGLTLSPSQETFINNMADDRLDVRLEDWAEHDTDEPYDAVIAAGVIEHAVEFGRPREEKVVAYRRFFEICHSVLKPGKRMALQTIGKGNVPLDKETAEDAMFISRDIFPLSDLPRLSELAHAAEKLFEVRTVRNDRTHYVKTLNEWKRRLNANRERAIEIVGDHMYEQYDRFLAASERQFERRQLTLLRFSLERVN
jgi:cyclopropane-fatty-acyl-phospholipid synthase